MLSPMLRFMILALTVCLAGCGGAPKSAEHDHAAQAAIDEADAPEPADDATPDVPEPEHDAPPAEPVPAAAEPEPAPEPAPWVEAVGHLGKHTLAWRPLNRDGVPRNEEFELELLVTRDGQPADVQIQVTGWMPAHSHGLVQMPLVEKLADGRHNVTGLLLHMRGAWQLRASILAARSLDTVTSDLDL